MMDKNRTNVSQGVVPQTSDLARRIGCEKCITNIDQKKRKKMRESHVLPLVGRMNFLIRLLNWSVRLKKRNSELIVAVS